MGTAIALLIWMYLVSFVVLVGAEFNAERYPRCLFGSYSRLETAANDGEESENS